MFELDNPPDSGRLSWTAPYLYSFTSLIITLLSVQLTVDERIFELLEEAETAAIKCFPPYWS